RISQPGIIPIDVPGEQPGVVLDGESSGNGWTLIETFREDRGGMIDVPGRTIAVRDISEPRALHTRKGPPGKRSQGNRPAGKVCYRHGGRIPGRRADPDPGERHGERPGLPAGVQRVPPRPSPAERGRQPGEAEDDPGRVTEHLLAVQHRRGDGYQLA